MLWRSSIRAGYPDMGEATERMAILCDNAYRRINDSSCAAYLPTSIDGTGNVMRVSTTHIDSGNFRPDTVVAGMFTILANSTVPEKLEIKPAHASQRFCGEVCAGYDAGTHALRAEPGAGPGALVCAARRGGHHLQARQASPPARRCPCAISFCGAPPARERPRVPAPSLRA